ncbi:hypothetical protein FMEAI12_6670005 [Parafrankia sp. Ea1.12]|nr:hypothetical protein FMEAI12_6670005 [Parafrankia sp. Ea1.12]
MRSEHYRALDRTLGVRPKSSRKVRTGQIGQRIGARKRLVRKGIAIPGAWGSMTHGHGRAGSWRTLARYRARVTPAVRQPGERHPP